MKAKISLRDIFKYYQEPHQLAALSMLEEAMEEELLSRDSDWIVCFYAEPNAKEPLTMEEKAMVRSSGRVPHRKD